MNVQSAWRRRSQDLRSTYWICPDCGAGSLVRRLHCGACGASLIGRWREQRLGAPSTVLCWSHAHVQIERLDQRTVTRGAVLVEGPAGRPLPWPLCANDVAFADALVGCPVELQLRRHEPEDRDPSGPIAYLMKAHLSAETRSRLISHAKADHSEEKI